MIVELAVATAILTGTENQILAPEEEAKIALAEAEVYGLTFYQTLLLLALRRCEGGPKGIEFGVGSGDPGHTARRFTNGHPEDSFRVQAQWTAGTIRKHYLTRHDLAPFMLRWNPKGWQQELENVRFYLDKFGGGEE